MAFSAPVPRRAGDHRLSLVYVALTDFKQFKIRNELIIVLAGLLVV